MTSWTFLLVLYGALTSVLCCNWLKHYSHLSETSVNLLRSMGDQLTHQRSPVHFPHFLYRRIRKAEVESQLCFIRDSLELIAGLYHHDNRSCVAWDTDKTERFLMTIDRQTDGLNSCVSTNSSTDGSLMKYYEKLENRTLYRTGGSTASWELIRKESERHLHQLELLVNFIRDPASRRRSTPSQHRHTSSVPL